MPRWTARPLSDRTLELANATLLAEGPPGLPPSPNDRSPRLMESSDCTSSFAPAETPTAHDVGSASGPSRRATSPCGVVAGDPGGVRLGVAVRRDPGQQEASGLGGGAATLPGPDRKTGPESRVVGHPVRGLRPVRQGDTEL